MREGWKLKSIGEICLSIFAGGDKPKDNFSLTKTKEFNVPVFANGEKEEGLYGFTNIPKVVEPSITISARGTIGYTVLRNEPFYPIVRLIVIVPDLEIITLIFLNYVVGNIDFKNSGTSIPQLTVPMVKNYEIPIPPIAEQKQIVAILDQAFEAIDQAKANIEKNIVNAKELFQSKLNEIFSHPSTGSGRLNEGWEEKTLEEITTKIGSGATPRGGQESYKETGISLIRSMNVHDSGFRPKKLAFIDDEQAGKLNNVAIEENDILLNITGASVARCCIVENDYLPARVNQHVSIIRLKEGIMSHRFLHYALTSKDTKTLLLGIGSQGATRQAITKVQIENFKIKYPKDLKFQNKIIQSLDIIREQTKATSLLYAQKLTALEELKKSILEKAFSGELTN